MSNLSSNNAILTNFAILEKLISKFPPGSIKEYREKMDSGEFNNFPVNRLELIRWLDNEFSLMNELTSLMIEFKWNSLGQVFDHIGRGEDMDAGTCSTVSNNEEN